MRVLFRSASIHNTTFAPLTCPCSSVSFSFAGGTCLLGVAGVADAEADIDDDDAPAAAAAYFNGGNVGAAGLGRPALSTEAIGA